MHSSFCLVWTLTKTPVVQKLAVGDTDQGHPSKDREEKDRDHSASDQRAGGSSTSCQGMSGYIRVTKQTMGYRDPKAQSHIQERNLLAKKVNKSIMPFGPTREPSQHAVPKTTREIIGAITSTGSFNHKIGIVKKLLRLRHSPRATISERSAIEKKRCPTQLTSSI